MRDNVDFRSARFRPAGSESDQVNPGRYGQELAAWIAEQLSLAGFSVSAPQAEDWGWALSFGAPARSIFLGCGNVEGEKDLWRVFVHERPRMLDKLFGTARTPSPAKLRLIQTLHDALGAEPSVSDIEWFGQTETGQETDRAPQPL